MLKTLREEDFLPEVKLDLEYQHWVIKRKRHLHHPSLVAVDLKLCKEFVKDVHEKHGKKYSWGGLWEDRSAMYAHPELYLYKKRAFWHLAIDVNAPAGTPVCVDRPCTVLHIGTDYRRGKKQDGGWGRHVVVKLDGLNVVLLYAHLRPGVLCAKGDKLEAGQMIGRIGESSHNGGWWEHVHVQAMSLEVWEYYYPDHLHELDGYCRLHELPKMQKRFLNPMRYVSIP